MGGEVFVINNLNHSRVAMNKSSKPLILPTNDMGNVEVLTRDRFDNGQPWG